MLKDDIYTIIWSKRDASGNCGWCTRAEIKRTLGVNYFDTALLDALLETRHIVVRKRYSEQGHWIYEYRAIEPRMLSSNAYSPLSLRILVSIEMKSR